MNKEGRIRALEDRTLNIPELQGVLFFHPGEIIVDGVPYQAVEDVPQELRLKYEGAIAVGQVETRDGRTAEVVA